MLLDVKRGDLLVDDCDPSADQVILVISVNGDWISYIDSEGNKDAMSLDVIEAHYENIKDYKKAFLP